VVCIYIYIYIYIYVKLCFIWLNAHKLISLDPSSPLLPSLLSLTFITYSNDMAINLHNTIFLMSFTTLITDHLPLFYFSPTVSINFLLASISHLSPNLFLFFTNLPPPPSSFHHLPVLYSFNPTPPPLRLDLVIFLLSLSALLCVSRSLPPFPTPSSSALCPFCPLLLSSVTHFQGETMDTMGSEPLRRWEGM